MADPNFKQQFDHFLTCHQLSNQQYAQLLTAVVQITSGTKHFISPHQQIQQMIKTMQRISDAC